MFVFAPPSDYSNLSEEDPQIVVFPNPTKDKINITLKGKGPYKIKIMDVYGKLIKTHASLENNIKISLESLSNGIYFLSTNCSNNELQMIVKN